MLYSAESNHAGNFKSALRFVLSQFWNYLHNYSFNNTHEKITRFWLAKSSAVQV